MRGETVEEITGAARIMRAKAVAVEAPPGTIDTCGTGGDSSGSFNISTASALVVAGCGVPVAKHGNRALSSKSGSADVLTALGVNIDADFAIVRRCLWEVGLGFMMAPRHHSATRHVAPARVELGTRTIFNLLGPLSSPAKAPRQLVGVFAPEWVRPMAEVLGRLGSERAWVVHGSGLDELTTAGVTTVAALESGKVETLEILAKDVGLPPARLEDLRGGDAAAQCPADARFAGRHGRRATRCRPAQQRSRSAHCRARRQSRSRYRAGCTGARFGCGAAGAAKSWSRAPTRRSRLEATAR